MMILYGVDYRGLGRTLVVGGVHYVRLLGVSVVRESYSITQTVKGGI